MKWIKTADEMPKPDERVLVYFETADGNKWASIAFYVPSFFKQDEGWFDGATEYHADSGQFFWEDGWYEWNFGGYTEFAMSQNITHWMPLPDTPKG